MIKKSRWLASAVVSLWVVTPLIWAQSPAPNPATPSIRPDAPAPTSPGQPALTAPPSARTPGTLNEAKAAEKDARSSPLDSSLFYQLLMGELTTQDGDAAAGFALLLDAARKTGNPELYQRATDIALQSRSGDSALQAATAWKKAVPGSRDANRYVLQILIALNRTAETLEPLQSELAAAPVMEQSLAISSIPRVFARASDKKLAASTVEQALLPYLNNPATAGAAWTTLARMRLAAVDAAGALLAAQRGLASDPKAEGPVIVALEMMSPQRPAAETLVKGYLAANPATQPELRMAYARALLDAQRYAEASAQLTSLTRDKPDFPDSWLVLGTLQLQDNQLSMAQTSLERYLALLEKTPSEERKRGIDQAYLSLSQLAEKRKDYKGAESWLAKIENSSELLQAQVRRASILASQGRLDEGRKLIVQLPDRTPEDARAKLAAEAGLLREFKQYKLAHDFLATAVLASPNDAELIYDQAMMAEKIQLLPHMEQLLRRAISIKPDYHHAYNALGYSLADRNVRLPEAKVLIEKALSLAPSDPFIQDSLGWVEFRLGNKTQAARIFETAYKAKPDAEIAAHYGEVLLSLGQRERALAIFREGLLLNPDNEALRATLKRLRLPL